MKASPGCVPRGDSGARSSYRRPHLASLVHVALGPGEALLPGTRAALDALFEDARVVAVLVPLVPQGEHALARAARRYLDVWDARFLHAQNFFAPATRLAMREPIGGFRNAEVAPLLADIIATGGRVAALRHAGAAARLASDLSSWTAHFRAEGRAWAELAARDVRFARFAPPPWARHNAVQAARRIIEILQARRALDPLVVGLHLARESAFSDVAPLSQRSSSPPPA